MTKGKYLTRSFLLKKQQSFSVFSSQVRYSFIIGSKKFLLKDEPLEEVLRERFQYCSREKKLMNFWLLITPNLLKSLTIKFGRNRLPDHPIIILSTNESFVHWLKLRYHHVAIGYFFAPLPFILNPLK